MPRPHQQQCPSNIVECYKSNDSFECRMLLRHCCRFWQQCCRFRQQCWTKFRPFDKVKTNWTCSTLSKGQNFTIESFDIVASVDGAYEGSSAVLTRASALPSSHFVCRGTPAHKIKVGYANFADSRKTKSVTISTCLERSWKEGRVDHAYPLCEPVLPIWWKSDQYIQR